MTVGGSDKIITANCKIELTPISQNYIGNLISSESSPFGNSYWSADRQDFHVTLVSNGEDYRSNSFAFGRAVFLVLTEKNYQNVEVYIKIPNSSSVLYTFAKYDVTSIIGDIVSYNPDPRSDSKPKKPFTNGIKDAQSSESQKVSPDQGGTIP